MKFSRIIIILTVLFPIHTGLIQGSEIQKASGAIYDWVRDVKQNLTLREKIAQMVITYSDGYLPAENSKEFSRLSNLVINEKVGGIIFFKGNSIQQAELTNKLQMLAETPLLISQDCERGTGMRLDDGSIFPSNMALGATWNKELAYQMGLQIAKECKAIGVQQNYAPVMDINNNPLNPIINVRSFGEKASLVSELGCSMIKGLQDGGVIATAKHFPGHGDTEIDSHSDMPVIKFNITRLKKVELIPFRDAVDCGVKSVMTAHISFPALEPAPFVPASLSPSIVNDILRERLSFDGLAITDALNMAGITKHFSAKEVAIMCVKAGIDLILMPQGEKETIDEIEKAVTEGKISEARIDASVNRILYAKAWAGLNENKTVNTDKISSVVNSYESRALSQKIADESVTLVKNDRGNIPFGRRMIAKEKCMLISLNNGKETANSDKFIELFTEENEKLFGKGITFDITGDVTDPISILSEAKNYNYAVIPVFAKVKIKTGTVGIPESQIKLINDLIAMDIGVVVISFGNPYLLQGFEKTDCYICAYGDCESSVKAVIKGLFGQQEFKGRLPITITEKYKFGDGLNY